MFLGKVVSLIISAFSGPHGDMDGGEESLSSKVETLERRIEQVSVKTAGDTCGANTALARPILNYCDGCPCENWYFTLAPLFWHAKVDGTAFAYSSARSPVSLPIVGRIKRVDFDWDVGFRASVGYQFYHGGWDAFLRFTTFSTHGSEHSRSGENDILVPLKGSDQITQSSGIFSYCKSAKSQFELHFRKADLNLGRHFFVEEFLSIRPHIGLSAYMLYLDQITRYFGGEIVNDFMGLGKNAVHIRDVSCFGGIGPEIGLDTTWHMSKKWSLVGNVSTAIYYGRYVVHHAEKYSIAFPKNVIHLKDNFHGFTPSAFLDLGLQYDTYLNQDRNHFRMKICYNTEYYFRVNQMQNVNFTLPESPLAKFQEISSDVGFHGFELNFRVDF